MHRLKPISQICWLQPIYRNGFITSFQCQNIFTPQQHLAMIVLSLMLDKAATQRLESK